MKREICVRGIADRAERRAARVTVALAEALHLEQAAPGERRRDREVAVPATVRRRSTSATRPARGRRRRRAARRAGCRTSASGRASARGRSRPCPRRRPGSAGGRTRRRGSRATSDTRSCPGRCRRRRVGDVEQQRARHEVEDDRALDVRGRAVRADRDDVEHGRAAGDRDGDAERAVGARPSPTRSSSRSCCRCSSRRRRPCCRAPSCPRR